MEENWGQASTPGGISGQNMTEAGGTVVCVVSSWPVPISAGEAPHPFRSDRSNIMFIRMCMSVKAVKPF